jgi:SAM-dependent methyltransferase
MISRPDVIAAYRTVLGREPENDQVVQDQIEAAESIEQLYQNFIESEEFREVFLSKLAPSDLPNPHKPLDWPPIHVESKVSGATQLATMFARVNRAWTRYGQQEPYFSVCTDSELRGADIGEQATEFYASGQGDVHYLTSFAARSGIELASRSCFELGCGVGRVTRWLAPLFRRVYAADISPGHLAITQRVLAESGIENVSLMQLRSLEDLRQIVKFDVFFSVITLQHNPPPLTAYILTQVLTNLNVGGLAFFQLPTYALDYEFKVDDYMNASTEGEPEMEMHVLPQRDVMGIAHMTGCQLLELREDGYTGDRTHISNTFFVRKTSDPSAKEGSVK